MVEQDPDDTSARRNLGYILRKLDRLHEAVAVFVQLANEYAENGFMLKAIATCKVVLEIDPNHTETQQRLAELYSNRSGSSRPDLKVMTESSEQAASASSQNTSLATDAIELPASDEAEFQVERSTPPAALYGMVDLPGSAENKAGDDGTGELIQGLPVIEMVELDASLLMPYEPEKSAEPAPVVGTPVEPPPPGIELEPTSLAGAEEAAPASEYVKLGPQIASDDLELEPIQAPAPEPEAPAAPAAEAVPVAEVEPAVDDVPMPDIDIELDFDLDESAPMQESLAAEIPLFCELEPGAFVALVERMGLIRARPKQWILREGSEGSSLFTIASGKVRVLKKLEGKKMLQLAVLGEGTFFGEMSLLRGGVRGASVQALEASELFEITRELIDEVSKQYPAVQDVLVKFAHQRLLRNVMVTSPLFRPFNKEERIKIIECFVSRDVEDGEVLIEEGIESDGLYVVMRGELEVSCKTEDDKKIVVGSLVEGEVFGEISCLRKQPAIATVRANVAGSVLRLPRSDFETLVLSHPQILVLVSELSDMRIAATSSALAQKGILI